MIEFERGSVDYKEFNGWALVHDNVNVLALQELSNSQVLTTIHDVEQFETEELALVRIEELALVRIEELNLIPID